MVVDKLGKTIIAVLDIVRIGSIICTYRRVHLLQVLPPEGETRVQVAAVHTGLLACRRGRRCVYQSDCTRSFHTGGPRSGVLGRAMSKPKRPVSAQLTASGVVFVVVQVAGEQKSLTMIL